jgi:hypothetical protein
VSELPAETPWLTAAVVVEVLGPDIGAQVDMDPLERFAAGCRAYVEGARSDLLVLVDGVAEFAATDDVVLGAALLTYRFYQRRRSVGADTSLTFESLAENEDPDIARLLGVGSHGRFVFGAATTITTT